MKKAIFALLSLTLMITSCTNAIYHATDDMGPKKAAETTILAQYSDFTYISSEDKMTAEVLDTGCNGTLFYSPMYENSIIIKLNDVPCIYNDETGNIGSLCIDPLCLHDTMECPYGGMTSGVILKDNKAYFNVFKPLEEVRGFYELDLKSGRKRELRVKDMGLGCDTQFYDDDFSYFYEAAAEDDPENKTSKTVWIFYRQDMKTLKWEELERSVDMLDIQLFGRYGDRFLFHSGVTGNLLTAPVDNVTDRSILFDGYAEFAPMMVEGDTIFFIEIRDGQSSLSSIRADGIDYKSYPIENLCDFGTPFYVTKNYIYFMYDEPVELPENNYADEISPRKIWRMNRETEEITLAYEMDERLDLVDIEQFVVKGNYIYAKYVLFTEDYQTIDDSEGYLRLGIADGSIYLINWD